MSWNLELNTRNYHRIGEETEAQVAEITEAAADKTEKSWGKSFPIYYCVCLSLFRNRLADLILLRFSSSL